MIFNPYAVGTQLKMCQNDKYVDRPPTQQSLGTDSRIDMAR